MIHSLKFAINKIFKEDRVVLLVLLQSFFLGVFLGGIQVASTVMYLQFYAVSTLPFAFMLSGFVILGLVLFVAFFYNRLNGFGSAFNAMSFILVVAIAVSLGVNFLDSKRISLVIFVGVLPLLTFLVFGMWKVMRINFPGRDETRVNYMLDNALGVGVMMVSYSFVVIFSYSSDLADVVHLSTSAAACAWVFQLLVTIIYHRERDERQGIDVAQTSKSIKSLFSKRFMLNILLYALIAVFTTFIIYYAFLSLAVTNYPWGRSLAKFLGFFTGTGMLLSLLIRAFVTKRLIRYFGLREILLIIPLVLLFFGGIASFTAKFWGDSAVGYGLGLFFLIIVFTHLVSVSLNEFIDNFSFKVLFNSINWMQGNYSQSIANRVLIAIAMVTTGVALAAFVSIPGLHIRHLFYLMTFVSGFWLFYAVWLYRAYKRRMIVMMNQLVVFPEAHSLLDSPMIPVDYHLNERSSIYFYRLLNFTFKAKPIVFDQLIRRLVDHSEADVRKRVYSIIEELKLSKFKDILLKRQRLEKFADVIATLNGVINRLDQEESKAKQYLEQVPGMVRSTEKSKRLQAANMLGMSDVATDNDYWVLMHDEDQEVRECAISNAGTHTSQRILKQLVSALNEDDKALIGVKALGQANLSVDSSRWLVNQVGNLRSIGRIRLMKSGVLDRDPVVLSLFVQGFTSRSKNESLEMIREILFSKYSINDQEKRQVLWMINKTAESIGWCLAVKAAMGEEEKHQLLIDAMDEEVVCGEDLLYKLLTLIGGVDSITYLRMLLSNDVHEDMTCGLELLEALAGVDLREKLNPILLSYPISKKLDFIGSSFPVRKLEPLAALELVINRELFYFAAWSKLCAMYTLGLSGTLQINDSLVSCLFHPDQHVSNTAANVIAGMDYNKYRALVKRVEPAKREKINEFLLGLQRDPDDLVIAKVLFLRQNCFFAHVPSELLLSLAGKLNRFALEAGHRLTCTNEDFFGGLLFVKSGVIDVFSGERKMESYKINQMCWPVYTFFELLESLALVAREDVVGYILSRRDMERLAFEYSDIEQSVVNYFARN
jgi:hypothetical protein